MAKYNVTNKTKNKIKKAAFELFWELDYNQVTCTLIAEKANVKLGTLTYHFPKKEQLYQEYINYLSESVFFKCNEIIPSSLKNKQLTFLIFLEGVFLYNEMYSYNFSKAIFQGTSEFYDFLDQTGKDFYLKYVSELISERDAFLIFSGWNGVECGICRMLYHHPNQYTFDEVFSYMFKTTWKTVLNTGQANTDALYAECLDTILKEKPLFSGDFSSLDSEN